VGTKVSIPSGHPPTDPVAVDRVGAPSAARVRRAYLDNLKVVLVTGVILGHAFITYGDIGSWAYRETSTNDVFNIVAAVVVSLGSLFAMGLFFLIAGLLTPGPAHRKGPRAFLRDRALRLGVPFLAYLLLVYPLVNWAGEREHPVGWYLREQLTELDPGPLWFVGVLWMFSAVYVAWRSRRPATAGSPPLRGSWLLALAAAIAVGSFVVRLGFAINSQQVFAAHVWQWPQCIGLFVLGTLAAERGWLQPVPATVRRVGGWAALAATVVILGAMATATSLDPFTGGLTWQAALTATCEGTIAVGLSVWLLGTFQNHFDHAGPLATALGRAAFGAYILQAPVLVTIALLASNLPLTPEAKFVLVAPTAIAASFALAWLLTRLPGTRQLL
jgi:fucose 4-O-acetylase-like acetyltransferase